MFMVCVCVCACTRMCDVCACVFGDLRLMSSVILNCSRLIYRGKSYAKPGTRLSFPLPGFPCLCLPYALKVVDFYTHLECMLVSEL